MDNMISVEKVQFKDIKEVIVNFFSTSKEEKDEKDIQKELERVYKVQEEIGATKGIKSAEIFVEKFALKSAEKKSVKKVNLEEIPNSVVNKKLQKDSLEIDEEFEK